MIIKLQGKIITSTIIASPEQLSARKRLKDATRVLLRQQIEKERLRKW